jgi:transcriptional regulator with XRE-family HTH domain
MARYQESVRTGPTYRLAEFLNQHWEAKVGMTNEEVAGELGYRAGNIVSMWRTGKTRVPLERLPDIARLMKLDLGVLLPLWFEQYYGDRADGEAMERVLIGRVVTERESALIRVLREASPTRDPSFHGDIEKAIVAVAFNEDIRKGVLATLSKATKAPGKKAATAP